MRVQTKICGTTSPADARLAQDAGTDFVGVIVHHPASPRHVSLEMACQIRAAITIPLVAVSVNLPLKTWLDIAEELRPDVLQLHGDETPELVKNLVSRGFSVWKAIAGDQNALESQARGFTEAGASALVVDAREKVPGGVIYGGTGHLSDWTAARHLVERGFRVILAGGLHPENVARAVEWVRPWGVDVVSGVEASKGVKAAHRVRTFVAQTHITPTITLLPSAV